MACPQPKTSTTVPGSSNQALLHHLCDLNDGLFELQLALDGHDALETLLVYCSQNLNGVETNIPVAPDKLASLLAAVNQRVRHQVEALKTASHCAVVENAAHRAA